ncbi:MBL fold metallo-hydrolase [Gracilimonas mengyeensis]|uniref:L-ascorbate metabolism protein UlaG, beta-lactamase superfamily n=1 Tax=Gracilimonas mengyeensis TaxID=1302730 RepID=A0A521DUY1_9BACT|nr:MBL fold metallo-hydrolase [Gracilimonas mengyeensis]SMO75524.1 L-ascorbate metabolism protein UlaG, beta-lactamase superfamily [Gracilimonas mengyeensis]
MYRFLLSVLFFICFSISPVLAQSNLTNTPDTVATSEGELVIHPIVHGTVAFEWNNQTIFVDPYGGATRFEQFDSPDLILITHAHGDHLNPETLSALDTNNATFIVPQSVAEQMDDKYQEQLIILDNGDSTEELGINVLAFPMYNLPEEGARHAKGWGNGYVLTMGGTTVYLSGDTEGIPEMRALTGIDIAFICMNLPYTMDVKQAASAVLDFEPTTVYPYHHRGQDIQEFKGLVDAGQKDIEVQLKNWYADP